MDKSLRLLNLKKLEREGKLKNYVYDNDVLIRYIGNEKTVQLPNCFTEVGADAFLKNKNIRKVVIPESYVVIGDRAFRGCYNLNDIELGEVLTIGNSSFSECSLWELRIPETVGSVGNLAFDNNKALRMVDIGGKETWFEKDSFRGCDGVYSLYIHKELLIGDIGFNCMDDIDIIYK